MTKQNDAKEQLLHIGQTLGQPEINFGQDLKDDTKICDVSGQTVNHGLMLDKNELIIQATLSVLQHNILQVCYKITNGSLCTEKLLKQLI